MTTELIQSGDELKEYFFEIRKIKRKTDAGVMVRAGIRREILTSIDQGKMLINGRVEKISFKNMTGGVYRANIGWNDEKNAND